MSTNPARVARRIAPLVLALSALACNLTSYRATPTPTLPAAPVAATSTLIPTMTPISKATATAASPSEPSINNAAKPPGSGNVLFADSFDTRSNRWEQFEDEVVSAHYVPGRFRIDVKTPGETVWSVPDVELRAGDALFEAEATLLAGPPDVRYGLVFRYQGAFDFYLFTVSGDGAAAFDRLQGGEWRALRDAAASSAVAVGQGATNRLGVLAAGDWFTFYVNGEEVAQATDGAFASGGVALLVATGAEGGAEVAFDNVSVVSR